MTIRDVIQKYFRDEQVLFFKASDALSVIEGDTYLKYKNDGITQLWFGGESGEVCLMCTNNPDSLEVLIKAILFG